MADLKVDFTVLRNLQQSLVAVAREFEELHERRDLDKQIWGGSHTRSAMDDFGSNWDRHREELTEHIRKLGEQCGGVCEVFQGVDQAVARAAGGE
jgi:hypothetical protein